MDTSELRHMVDNSKTFKKDYSSNANYSLDIDNFEKNSHSGVLANHDQIVETNGYNVKKSIEAARGQFGVDRGYEQIVDHSDPSVITGAKISKSIDNYYQNLRKNNDGRPTEEEI